MPALCSGAGIVASCRFLVYSILSANRLWKTYLNPTAHVLFHILLTTSTIMISLAHPYTNILQLTPLTLTIPYPLEHYRKPLGVFNIRGRELQSTKKEQSYTTPLPAPVFMPFSMFFSIGFFMFEVTSTPLKPEP